MIAHMDGNRTWNTRPTTTKDLLYVGQAVLLEATGGLLHPVVRDGELAMFEPVLIPSQLMIGDVIFAEVRPQRRNYVVRVHTSVQ